MMRKEQFYSLCMVIVSMLFIGGCGQQSVSYEKSHIVMDTVVTLSATGPQAKAAVEESFDRLAELEEMASPNIKTSDVAKLREAAGKNFVSLHDEVYYMLVVSQQYSALSNGAWDVTMGPIINLWGIGTDAQRIPADNEIKEKLQLVGYHKLLLREADKSAMLMEKGMEIDLGGIAKGFAADEVRKIYKKYKIENGLINLGASTMYAIGKNKEGKPWAVGIKHPRKDDRNTYLGVVHLEEEALSTSGDYERFFEENGKRYHHIFDPKTGYPADSGAMSDTIVIGGDVTDCGMLSDLLTTTVFILGPEKGIAFIASLPDAMGGEITAKDGQIYTTKDFSKRILDLHEDFSFSSH